MYSGLVTGTGTRYCPSIEDKIMRFADKDRHQIFIEPEGRSTDEMYVQGMSTSLPYDVQVKMLHTIPGLERAEVVRAGYAIEYDCIKPDILDAALMCRQIPGLYFAGQINGSSGYEEAAAQGIYAGINCALRLRGEEPLLLSRADAYIGVLVDDLATKGHQRALSDDDLPGRVPAAPPAGQRGFAADGARKAHRASSGKPATANSWRKRRIWKKRFPPLVPAYPPPKRLRSCLRKRAARR